MKAALLPSESIHNADELRRAYRTRILDPKYQNDDVRSAELEVAAVLQHLLSDLDAGNIADTGQQFHARCLGALSSVRLKFPDADMSFLQGALYSSTDRCRHRFLRAVP